MIQCQPPQVDEAHAVSSNHEVDFLNRLTTCLVTFIQNISLCGTALAVTILESSWDYV